MGNALLLALLFFPACLDYNLSGGVGKQVGTEPGTSLADTGGRTLPDNVDTGSTGAPTDDETGGSTTAPIASAPVYANTSDQLFEIDHTTGDRTLVGTFQDATGTVSNMVDIAIDLDGHLFGATFDTVYSIDPLDATVAAVCTSDISIYAMTFTSTGDLIAGAADKIVVFDLSRCIAYTLVEDSGYETSGDLVGLPDGYLYWTVLGDDADELVRVDPYSGALQWVGQVGAQKIFGLGYDDGELCGFTKDGDTVEISPDDASTVVRASDSSVSWWGATTNPVTW
ncbi:MAG: hypothetical protein GXP62_00680 [Oligoflexia bacterium]|nr:hypothetical protein [Oligoflexia bacterium]